MRVKIQQFLGGKSHSWQVVGCSLGREFLKLGHTVEFISTDGKDLKIIPEDLAPFYKDQPTGKYDIQLSYTAPHNWPVLLNEQFGGKKFAIWNYEYPIKNNKHTLLPGFAKFHNYVDKVLPSSNFTKEVFLGMKIPSEKMVVVPHGVNLEQFNHDRKYLLKTNKSKKILLNIAQPHKRKAIHLALESFGKAFNKNDDVCLVAKILKQNKTDHIFNVDFQEILKNFEKTFPNHAEVEVVYDYISDISEIYNSCDINFSSTFAECWHLPSLEALCSGLINIVPNYGGQLDFCNNNNSLLINGEIIRCPKDHLYWHQTDFAVHFKIDTNDAAKKLQQAYSDYNNIKQQFLPEMKKTVEKFSWENAAKQILSL